METLKRLTPGEKTSNLILPALEGGMFKGMLTRMPSLLRAMFVNGYVPWLIKGSMTTMPADFLVDENGVIQTAYYGKDEGDHLPFERVKAFSFASNKMSAKPVHCASCST